MPSRLWIGLILVGWLATMGWFIDREFPADNGPPFTVELADEASPQIAHWTVYQGDKKIGRAVTTMTYKENDTFELTDTMHNIELSVNLAGTVIPIKVPELSTHQRVTRDGKLISVESKVRLSLSFLDFESRVTAAVKEGMLYPVVSVHAFFLDVDDRPLAPVALASGSMWNPMHPHARIRVHPGQRWRLAAMNPLSDAVKNSLPQIGQGLNAEDKKSLGDVSFDRLKMLNAEVLPEPQELAWGTKKYTCYVIEYRDADDITQTVTARTWVQVSDAKVIRQEAILETDSLMLQRDE